MQVKLTSQNSIPHSFFQPQNPAPPHKFKTHMHHNKTYPIMCHHGIIKFFSYRREAWTTFLDSVHPHPLRSDPRFEAHMQKYKSPSYHLNLLNLQRNTKKIISTEDSIMASYAKKFMKVYKTGC